MTQSFGVRLRDADPVRCLSTVGDELQHDDRWSVQCREMPQQGEHIVFVNVTRPPDFEPPVW